MKILFVLVMFLGSAEAHACKCLGMSSPREMFDKADLVFVGQHLVTDAAANKNGAQFKLGRILKKSFQIGSDTQTLKWAGGVPEMCRAYSDKGVTFIVFGALKKDGSVALLSDCSSDVIEVKDKYYYRDKTFADFDFFKVSALSAINGLQPQYASSIAKADAQNFAQRYLLQKLLTEKKDPRQYELKNAELKVDSHAQNYWSVIFVHLAPTKTTCHLQTIATQ